MKRAIVTPAILPPSALAELKQWLAISTTHDDAPLSDLLRSSLETCEAFTGTVPLAVVCEEVVAADGCWRALATAPVAAITQVETIGPGGMRAGLPAGAWTVDLDADGRGRVCVIDGGGSRLAAVTFSAGLATDWDALPDGLRQGVIRLAAHQHRQREGSGAGPLPPAAVSALWRPWRRLRLA